MSFWFDDPRRRQSYPSGAALELDEPDLSLEFITPLTSSAVLSKEARSFRPFHILSAVIAALAVHLALGFILTWSTPKGRLSIKPPADTATMFASLTPASSIALTPSVEPPAPATSVDTVSEATGSPSQTLASLSDEPPATETKAASSAQSAEVEEATLNTSRLATVNVAPLHKDTDNPWAHASIAAPALTTEAKLWAAIKPCLQAGGQLPPPIRIIFDGQGRVQRMTDEEGGDAQADPDLQAVSRAVLACEPYDGIVQSMGSYLVIAPG